MKLKAIPCLHFSVMHKNTDSLADILDYSFTESSEWLSFNRQGTTLYFSIIVEGERNYHKVGFYLLNFTSLYRELNLSHKQVVRAQKLGKFMKIIKINLKQLIQLKVISFKNLKDVRLKKIW